MSQEESTLMEQEVQKMQQKGAIKPVQSSTNQFLSSVFIILKNDSGHRPVINLKKLNDHIPYVHFKMKGLIILKEVLLKVDYMCKINLKNAYFSVLLDPNSQEFKGFRWKGQIYQFLFLCFGLDPAPGYSPNC